MHDDFGETNGGGEGGGTGLRKAFKRASLRDKTLYFKLNLIFGSFFLIPIFGFLYFAVQYEVLSGRHVPLFFLAVLVFSLLGFFILRNTFDKIGHLAVDVSKKGSVPSKKAAADEIVSIAHSFNHIENRLYETQIKLEKKISELAILKEISDLCYVTFDPEEILYLLLERSLQISRSDIGSVMIPDKNDRNFLVVKASVGLRDLLKVNERIPFETSIAKIAIINKSPLVVADVEKDTRFGRANRAHYGTKSFICMPIKTNKEVLGVLSLSRRSEDRPFGQEDVDTLGPLLSHAAFTYDNLRLTRENEAASHRMAVVWKIFKTLSLSIKDQELLYSVFEELRQVAPFDLAMVLLRDENRSDAVTIYHLQGGETVDLSRGTIYPIRGTVLERVLNQEKYVILDETARLSAPIEKVILSCHNLKSCLIAPLRMDGRVKGLLVMSSVTPDAFKEIPDVPEWMAAVLSLVVERNNLSAAILKRSHELNTIRQIGSALATSTFDIKKVLKYTMDMIRLVIDVEAGSLYFLESNELRCAVAFNIDVELIEKIRLKFGQGIAGYAAARGESIIVNDMRNSPYFFSGIDRVAGFETRSALCVPMVSQGKVIGVIEVLNKNSGEFSVGDQELLQSIASSVSIAIENARLYLETVSMAEQERGVRRMFQKFVPKEVVDKILNETDTVNSAGEEFKTLTLLNIDIRGFSGLARKLGPHKTVFLLNSFFSVMGGIVFKHHGIVDKYLGDGFLALFGAPVSRAADAENAIAAALEMRAATPEVNALFEKELGELFEPLMIGISIHTGEVVVGNIGFDKKMDYTVIGDPVNIVFRAQALTKSYPNGILISENTCRAAHSRLDLAEVPMADGSGTIGGVRIFELYGLRRD
jgi:class 3 adenylate cyclase/GAF domain-containing protein